MPGSNNSSKNLDEQLLKAIASDEYGKENNNEIQELIDEGADVNAEDKDGFTALMIATHEGKLEVFYKLYRLGAKVDAKSKDGITALMVASATGNEVIVKYLCDNERDPDVNAKSKDGYTALMFACESEKGDLEIVRELLKAGADPRLKNKKGISAYFLAKKPAIIELLSERIHELFNKFPNNNGNEKNNGNNNGNENLLEKVYPPQIVTRSPELANKRKSFLARLFGKKSGGTLRLKKGKRTLKTRKRTR
ncbi:ankyrin repeat domain-containing protein [bacterium]|nr:ankyrin repeat domain-containing protein [bacterium]